MPVHEPQIISTYVNQDVTLSNSNKLAPFPSLSLTTTLSSPRLITVSYGISNMCSPDGYLVTTVKIDDVEYK